MFNLWKAVAEPFVPLLKETQFLEKGLLTPEEFVRAGDELVAKCGTWAWSGGEEARRLTFLPADKQFLITRNVPCLQRVAAYQMAGDKEELVSGDGEDGADSKGDWVATHVGVEKTDEKTVEKLDSDAAAKKPVEVPKLVDETKKEPEKAPAAPVAAKEEKKKDFFADDEEDDQALEADPAGDDGFVVAGADNDDVMKTRTYDLSITYDRYFQTPRVWLFGYDEYRNPLERTAIMQDISAEHAHKTVTVEPHPHLGITCLSIHPCRHGSVMKKLVDMAVEDGKTPRVEFYMFYFLKFISTVIPTVEYDYTMDI